MPGFRPLTPAELDELDRRRPERIARLQRRMGPPLSYQQAVRRIRPRSALVVARMPTRYEIAAARAASRRQARRHAAELVVLALILTAIVLLIASRQ